MSQIKIKSEPLHNMPWEEDPGTLNSPVWRYSQNPVIDRNPAKNISRIFNSAVVPWQGEFIGVFRAEYTHTRPFLHLGHSKDALNWTIEEDMIQMVDEEGKPYNPLYAYDPRLVKVEDTYYIIWCTDFYGASLGVATTKDFKTFVRQENPFLPFNRNGVLFPRKINGMYKLMSRPSDSGHTPFGDIFISDSPDMKFWGNHRHIMGNGGQGWWQTLKIGGGPAPIETSEGWLMFYHGVTQTCNGLVYSMGGAILDLEEPSKVLYRCKNFLLTPEMPYEETGFVPNVIFPCAALCDSDTGRIAIYYGAADTYVGLAFTEVNKVMNYIKDNHEELSDDAGSGRM